MTLQGIGTAKYHSAPSNHALPLEGEGARNVVDPVRRSLLYRNAEASGLGPHVAHNVPSQRRLVPYASTSGARPLIAPCD